MTDYPMIVDCGGTPILLTHFEAVHLGAVKAFAQSLPSHDLLFLARDIQHPTTNLVDQGVSSATVESREDTLKQEILQEAAQHGGHDPDRVSFVAALRITRQSIAHQGDFPP